MNYIKLDSINSTNDYLKSYSRTHNLPDLFYVQTKYQTAGRGQRAHIWQSDCCENLLISYFVRPTFSLEKQSLLNKIVSISLVKLLENQQIKNVQVKLPNDIMVDGKKIAGILIENIVRKQKLHQSIIGIGLNVNQTEFVNLPEAVSMKSILNNFLNVDELAKELQQILINVFSTNEDAIHQRYQALSFFKPNKN